MFKEKTNLSHLAFFGGFSTFDPPLFVGRPNLGNQPLLLERIQAILDSRWLSNHGTFVQAFEAKLKEITGVKHCIPMANATIALEILFQALGLSPGDEVIVPAYTFIASAHALEWLGIKPIFADISPQTHSLDPVSAAQQISAKTKAILGVHLWGQACAIEELQALADQHHLELCFDAAHAFGSTYRGQYLGHFGRAEVFSFHATKFINAFEGGAIATNDDDLALKFQIELTHQRQTHNAEAYDYYLRGRRFYLQFSNRGMELALIMFKKAIEADEQYALAYAGMADCYSFQFQHKARAEKIIQQAEEASKKGIELAPTLAEAHVSRGIVLSLQGKFEEAEESFRYAIERDPTLFLGWYHYGRTCFAAGKIDKAARLFEQANRVEPEDFQSTLLAAQSYDDIGSKELARRLRQRGVELAEKRLELNPGDTRALYMAANALAFLDRPEKSFALIQRALALEPDDSMLLYNAACVYALLGMSEEALNCVEKAFEAGLTLRGWYENDSNLDSIREEPRFKAVMEKMTG